MDFDYVRRFCAYVSTFYHSEYITLHSYLSKLIASIVRAEARATIFSNRGTKRPKTENGH